MEMGGRMKTLIEMAREAGWQYADGDDGYKPLWRFAELVRADEREACAKIVEHILKEGGGTYGDAIRARGNI
jgi:hypothetical protein